MRFSTCRIALLGAATILLLAACGGDDDDVSADLAAQLQQGDEMSGVEISESEADCVADEMVDSLGEDGVRDAGFVSEDDVDIADLSEDELSVVAAAYDGCVEDIEAELAAEVKSGILESSEATLPIDDAEADCVANSVVEALGVERLLIVGAGSAEGDPFASGALSEEEAEAIADGFLACVDIRAVFAEQFRTEGLPGDVADCLAAEIDEEDLQSLFTAQFAGESVDPQELLGTALETCGVS